jgi:CheY-like chemotaxis protein
VLARVHSALELSVTDSGRGIAPEFVAHVFERFKQADSTSTRKYGGLGIGLAIVKSIVEMHGGTVSASSPGEGHGATFQVRIPVSPLKIETATAPGPAKPTWEAPPELDRLRVLVVDDDDDGREMVAAILERCGSIVTRASSVREAVSQFDLHRPDVIVSDIGMPDQDGYELIRQIRARAPSAGGNTPAASLTAYAGIEDRRRALLAGFNMHVAKPVDPAELVAVVASLSRFALAIRG